MAVDSGPSSLGATVRPSLDHLPPREGPAPRRPRATAGVALLLLVGCSPAVSTAPLPNARPEGPETYFYGEAKRGGKSLPDSAAAERKPVVLPTPPALHKKQPGAKSDTVAQSEPRVSPKPVIEDAGASSPPPAIAGRYLGTDTVVIEFPGIPAEPQVDDKAIVDIKQREGEHAYTLVVVASNTGEPLCSIDGQWRESELQFDAGQSCFEAILGIPLDANLLGGSAEFDGNRIEVEFQLELSLVTPGGTLEGNVDYSFEGTKEP